MALSQELQLRLMELRNKQTRGENLTMEELKEAIHIMRDGRVAAQVTSTKARTAKAQKAQPIDSDDLLSQLGI